MHTHTQTQTNKEGMQTVPGVRARVKPNNNKNILTNSTENRVTIANKKNPKKKQKKNKAKAKNRYIFLSSTSERNSERKQT